MTRTLQGARRRGPFVSPYAYEHFIRGELHRNAGRCEEAIEAYRRALASTYEDPLVLARLAECYAAAGEKERAEQTLEHALEVAPRFEGVWLARARVAERRGDFAQAAAAYERAEQVAPGSSRGPLALAELLQRRGVPERAARVLERALRRQGMDRPSAARARLKLALLQEDATAAAAALTQLLRMAPARSRDIVETAVTAMEQNDPFLAADMLEHVPAGAVPPALRLRIWLAAGRRARAEGLLATTDPEAIGGRLEAARAYLQLGRVARAEALARTEATLPDASREAWMVVGCATLAQGRHTAAVEAFAQAARSRRLQRAARAAMAVALRANGMDALATSVSGELPEGNPCAHGSADEPVPTMPAACAELQTQPEAQ